jgi:hypothetical protein
MRRCLSSFRQQGGFTNSSSSSSTKGAAGLVSVDPNKAQRSGQKNSNSTTVFPQFNGRLPNPTYNNHITHTPSGYHYDKQHAHLEPALRKSFERLRGGEPFERPSSADRSYSGGGGDKRSSTSSSSERSSRTPGGSSWFHHHQRNAEGRGGVSAPRKLAVDGGKKRVVGPDGQTVRDLEIEEVQERMMGMHLK